VIHERDRAIESHGLREKSVNRFVEIRKLLLARTDDEERHVIGKIVHRLFGVGVGEPVALRRIRHPRRAVQVEHVAVQEDRALQQVASPHQGRYRQRHVA